MSASAYSQFLYGKRPDVPGYQVVACTPDLADTIGELEEIVRRYRLWGSQPPVTQPVAMGVIPHAGAVLLISATTSARGPVTSYDSGGRPFVWYRFVFVPGADLEARCGRIWQFLEWIRALPPPTLPAQRTALAPLRPPPASAPDRAAEAQLVRRCLGVADAEGRPSLLTALGNLVAGGRLLLDERAHPDGVGPQEMAKALLLLLPAPQRGAVGLAVGDIDERACQWAGLALRRAGPPQSPLPPEAIWLKLSTGQLHGEVAQRNSRGYNEIVAALLDDDHMLPELLARLDALPAVIGGTRPGPAVAIPLLTLLHDRARREAIWTGLAAQVDLSAWAEVLPDLDAPLRPLLWDELLGRAMRGRTDVIPLLGRLARAAGDGELEALLADERAAHPAVGGQLLIHELLTAPELLSGRSAVPLVSFAVRVILAHSDSLRTARSIASCVLECPALTASVDRFRLLDAVCAALTHADELRTLVAGELGALLFRVPAAIALRGQTVATSRRLLKPLAEQLERVLSSQSLPHQGLPVIAEMTAMRLDQRAAFYAEVMEARQLADPQARWLIADLIAASRREAGDSAWSWRAALRAWEGAAERLEPLVRDLLDAAEGSSRWSHWCHVADLLLDDALQRVRFLDHALGGRPRRQLLCAWLGAIALDDAATASFVTSSAWQQMDGGADWVRQSIGALTGLVPLTADSPHQLLRLQAELELESAVLLTLLDRLAADTDQEGGGGMIAAWASVELQLHLGVGPGERGGAALRRLGAGSPPLAELALLLLTGRLDEQALERLAPSLVDRPSLVGGWLAAAGHAALIKGPLLRALTATWLRNPPSEGEGQLIRALLALPEQLPDDRVTLLEIGWLPGRPWGTPAHCAPLPEASLARLVEVACAAVGRCETQAQVAHMLADCARLGLRPADRVLVLRAVEPVLRSVELIQAHLFTREADGEERLETAAMDLLLQVSPSGPERERLHVALTSALAYELRRPESVGGLRLGYWRSRTQSSAAWQRAVEAAVTELVGSQVSPLLEKARRLGAQGLAEEGRQIYDALHLHLLIERPEC